jgi:hypothetical protein
VGAHLRAHAVGQRAQRQAVGGRDQRDRDGHRAEGDQATVLCRVDEEREEGHVEDDRLRVEQRDQERLAQVVPGGDAHDGGGAFAPHDQLQPDPCQIGCTGVLDRSEPPWMGRQQRGHPADGQPQQHLVTHEDAGGGGCAGAQPSLRGGGQERKGARARQCEEEEHRGAEGAEIGDAKHRKEGDLRDFERATKTDRNPRPIASRRDRAGP